MSGSTPGVRDLTLLQRIGHLAGCAAFVCLGLLLVNWGIWVIGWLAVATFGTFGLMNIFARWLPNPQEKKYRVTLAHDFIQCEYPTGKPQTIHWNEVSRVVLATTSDGPWRPDRWLMFLSHSGEEMPIPCDAEGFEQVFDAVKENLPGFNFEPFIIAGTDDALYECWSRN